jgi:multidrug resistance efflux pump
MADQNEKLNSEEEAPPQKAPRDPVRLWTFIILGICFLLLVCYLRANRLTPYTAQARLHATVVPIAPEVSGVITSVEVENNQFVEAEQELFNIDKHNYELALQTAEAQFDAAQQATAVSAAAVDAAKASLAAAKSNLVLAKQDADRMRNIRAEDPGAISIRRLEVAESSQSSAEAAFTASKANVKQAMEAYGAEGEHNYRMLQAQAKLEHAEHDLARTTVRAPNDGIVTGVQLKKGKFAAAGSPQMTFIAIQDYWVQADFTENNLAYINPGSEVEMVFDAFPGEVFKGTVREMGFGVAVNTTPLGALPTIQNNRNWLRDAQRFPILIDFPAMENSRKMLKIGSQVTIVAYTGDHWFANALAKFYIRMISVFTYAY